MPYLHNTSIRRKQMLIIMLTTSVALLLACAAFISVELFSFRNDMVRNLTTQARIIGKNVSAALDFNDPKAAVETLSALQAQPNIIGACIFSPRGTLFAKYDRPGDKITFTPPPVLPATGYSFDRGRLTLFDPINSKGDVIGVVYLESDMQALHAKLAQYAAITTAVFVLAFLVALLLSSRLQRLISEPILDLVRTARAVAHDKNYSVRATKRSNDEIGVLIDGFNEMLGQIQERDAALESGREKLEARAAEREVAEKALRQSRDQLEQRVLERTAELGKSNESLLAEMAERVQAHAAMLAAEEKYRSIFENSISGIFLTSPEGRYLGANPSLARIYGYGSAGELMTRMSDIGRDLYVDPNRRAEFILLMEKHGLVKDFESQIYRKDKSVIWISENARAVLNPEGKITHYEGVVDDVSGRKQAEETLRLLGSAVEQSRESIIITDAELDLPGPRILFVNPAFTRMTGYTAEQALGKTPRILQGPRTDKKVLSRLRKDLEQGLEFEGEAINYRKDGKEFDLEWQIAPIRNAGGTITHFVAIQRDVTARNRMEQQMTQSQKMETVGKLAGGIAHEFNSIMTAIIGQSELLLNDLLPRDPLLKNAREIRMAADRAATLTRQLLAYGRKQILQPEILDLNTVLAGMDTMLRHLLGKNTDVCIVPALGLKAVKVDAGQIEQVVMNIAMNAADAMPNGGKLTLETANVTLDQEYVGRFPELKAGDYVMLAITDTGIGMSNEVIARAFEPFFSTKAVGEGTGLGLATCYGILKQSGGHITVYSEPSRGATFKIYLPQVEPLPKTPAPRLDSPDLPRGTETILLAEDDPALREMAATLLQRLGYTVLTAANGLEALNLKQQRGTGHIDLLFTDVVMPNMGGKELSDRIRALFPQTRILFTSAYTQGAIVHQGVLEAGVTLLQKPFTPSALARKVREVLDEPGALNPDPASKTSGMAATIGGENTS